MTFMLPYLEQSNLYNVYNPAVNWDSPLQFDGPSEQDQHAPAPPPAAAVPGRRPAADPGRAWAAERRATTDYSPTIGVDRRLGTRGWGWPGPPATRPPSAPGPACSPRTSSPGSPKSPTGCPTRSPSRIGRAAVRLPKGAEEFHARYPCQPHERRGLVPAGERLQHRRIEPGWLGDPGPLPAELHQRRRHRRADLPLSLLRLGGDVRGSRSTPGGQLPLRRRLGQVPQGSISMRSSPAS